MSNDMASAFAGAFSSPRLRYIAVEEDDTSHIDFIYTSLIANSTIRGLSSRRMFTAVTRAGAKQEISDALKHSLLGLLMTLDEKPIGILFLHKADWRRASITVQVADGFQGRGYGTEAVNWALDWSFRWGGLHKVEIAATALNERAVGLYKKLGFKEEGRQRDAAFFDGRWWDLVMLGILEGEWETLRESRSASGPPSSAPGIL
jgi:RimJ/RimL family protein N-acetyltransferase